MPQFLLQPLQALVLFALARLQVFFITRQQCLALLHIGQRPFGNLAGAARLRQLGLAGFDLGETLLQLPQMLLMLPLQLTQRCAIGDLQGLLGQLLLPLRVLLGGALLRLFQLLLQLGDLRGQTGQFIAVSYTHLDVYKRQG